MGHLRESLMRDVRFGLRILAARPGWTAAAVLCLAIATGANTAAFTLVNGLLLRSLPYEDPDRLVMVAIRDPERGTPRPFALREYRELGPAAAGTIQLLARTFLPLSLAGTDGARMAQAELVGGNYFETLRLTPLAGRFFDASADRDGAPATAVLSHHLWQARFGADPAVVGSTVRVNGRTVVVAGVAPAGFVGAMQLIAADLWLPARMYPDLAGSPSAAGVPMFGVMGRLAETVTLAQAEARMSALLANLPRTPAAVAPRAVIVRPAAGFGVPVGIESIIVALSAFIYLTMALLMAVACANVAALVLARGTSRSREIAVRTSLGASRLQIARQLLVESVVLAVAGCAAGSLVAVWLTQALVSRLTTPFQYVSYAIDVHPDMRVFAYSAAATVVAAALCGIAPIRFARRIDVVEVLKQDAAKTRSRESARTLNAMVVVQFAVSTVLLVASGMMVRAYVGDQTKRPQFDTSGLVISTLDLSQLQIDRPAGVRLFRDVQDRLAALPGVTAVSLTRNVPLSTTAMRSAMAEADHSGAARSTAAAEIVVSPNYFTTLGLALMQGRSFDASDTSSSEAATPAVAMINQAMAERLWPGASPLGRRFIANERPVEVVGVVANSDRGSATRPAQAAYYRPFPAFYAAQMTALVRLQGDAGPALANVRQAIRDINADLAIVELRTFDQLVDARAQQLQLPAAVLGIVGVLGLVLSGVGLFGVVSYSVRERARELGIRLALGARPMDVRRIVLRQGLTIVGIGLSLGAVATLAFSQVLRSSLFGLAARDPLLLMTVSGVLLSTAIAALYVPARWASRLDPVHTLRGE